MSKVLVVDDEVTLRDMITMVLEDAGHVVVTASNGTEALQVLARERAEVVLMDIMMPVLDGHEAFQRIRAHPELRHAPVVLMSAADPPRLDAALVGFLSKPFRLVQLLEVVTRPPRGSDHVDVVRSRRAPSRPGSRAPPRAHLPTCS